MENLSVTKLTLQQLRWIVDVFTRNSIYSWTWDSVTKSEYTENLDLKIQIRQKWTESETYSQIIISTWE